ncbi:MAG: hypothetical protein K6F00_05825 [Lachnospiraceae bacterium]|nr:hypothetical protein [Lachnospiraceae bacterium]
MFSGGKTAVTRRMTMVCERRVREVVSLRLLYPDGSLFREYEVISGESVVYIIPPDGYENLIWKGDDGETVSNDELEEMALYEDVVYRLVGAACGKTEGDESLPAEANGQEAFAVTFRGTPITNDVPCYSLYAGISGDDVVFYTAKGGEKVLPGNTGPKGNEEDYFKRKYEDCEYGFCGWSFKAAAHSRDSGVMKPGTTIKAEDFLIAAYEAGSIDGNGVITLYTVWDRFPELEVGDIDIGIDEAGSDPDDVERLLNDRLLAADNFRAVDDEDGEISESYCPTDTTGVLANLIERVGLDGEAFAGATVRVAVRDSNGNVTFAHPAIRVFGESVSDSDFVSGDSGDYLIQSVGMRLVNSDSLQAGEADGGLCEDSIWRVDESYGSRLRDAVAEIEGE